MRQLILSKNSVGVARRDNGASIVVGKSRRLDDKGIATGARNILRRAHGEKIAANPAVLFNVAYHAV